MIGRTVLRRGNGGKNDTTASKRTKSDDADNGGEKKPGKRMTTQNMGAKYVSVAISGVIGYPTSYREAIKSAEAEKWRDAIRSEIDSLKANGT